MAKRLIETNLIEEDTKIKDLKDNLREFTTSGSGPTNLLKQGEIALSKFVENNPNFDFEKFYEEYYEEEYDEDEGWY